MGVDEAGGGVAVSTESNMRNRHELWEYVMEFKDITDSLNGTRAVRRFVSGAFHIGDPLEAGDAITMLAYQFDHATNLVPMSIESLRCWFQRCTVDKLFLKDEEGGS